MAEEDSSVKIDTQNESTVIFTCKTDVGTLSIARKSRGCHYVITRKSLCGRDQTMEIIIPASETMSVYGGAEEVKWVLDYQLCTAGRINAIFEPSVVTAP